MCESMTGKSEATGRFPRGVELVTGAVIENEGGKIFLIQSPKWKNRWTVPGGHVEPGEKIKDALLREGKEETGLSLKLVSMLSYGEVIGSHDFHRLAHFVFIDAYCRVRGGTLRLEHREITASKWVSPSEALKMPLSEGTAETIKGFIRYKKAVRKGHGSAERDRMRKGASVSHMA